MGLYFVEALSVAMKPKMRRFLLLIGGLLSLGGLSFLLLSLLSESLVFFYTPSDLATKKISYGQRVRIGGSVAPGSFHREKERILFKLTDTKAFVDIYYSGPLPELFREGQEIIAEGEFQGPNFLEATSILAKHDEVYKPKTPQEEKFSSQSKKD